MWPTSLLSWFGEQTEAVKLALIAAVTGGVAGVVSVIREWRKPVLKTTTTPDVAPETNPSMALAVAIEALTVQMIELRKALEDLEEEQRNLREAVNMHRVASSKG